MVSAVAGGSHEVDYKNGVAKAMNPNLEYGSQVRTSLDPTMFCLHTMV